MREASSIQEASLNPVLSDFDLPLRRRLYPLGFPLDLSTNSRDVIEAAVEIWGPFSPAFDETPVRFMLAVAESDNEDMPPKPRFRAREHLMTSIGNAENFVTCDFRENLAYGWVTRAVAANHPFLRYFYLNGTPLMLAQQLRLAPIHGAMVALDGCGVLLCGESLAGKSTLSYACARAGWTFVADDGVFLVRNRADRYAVGNPYTVRFREEARALFPELAGHAAAERPNGKIGLEVFTSELPIRVAPGCSIEHVVFLNREEPGPARLRRYPNDAAMNWFESYACFGARDVRDDQIRCYRRLFGAGIWEMCYRDLDDAIERLDLLARSGG
jgi:hypothetical protein